MKKVVYLINDKPKILQDILSKEEFEIVIGDGKFNNEMLAQCWGLMSGRGFVTQEVLDKAPNLKIICKQGVGVDRINVQVCTDRGIYVVNTPQSNFISVAEHAMTLMLAVAKQIHPISLYLRKEFPDYACCSRYPAVELHGKTLAVIGFGSIGSRMAKMASGFDMKIVCYDPYANPVRIPDYVALMDTLEEALAQADFVSLHVAGIEANRGLMGAREFAAMKPTAIFINTTRGFIVDEPALYHALRNGVIAGAGLDVFADEPLKPHNPLMHLENLVATPHSAANTEESRRRAYLQCGQAFQDFAEGNRPTGAVNDCP